MLLRVEYHHISASSKQRRVKQAPGKAPSLFPFLLFFGLWRPYRRRNLIFPG